MSNLPNDVHHLKDTNASHLFCLTTSRYNWSCYWPCKIWTDVLLIQWGSTPAQYLPMKNPLFPLCILGNIEYCTHMHCWEPQVYTAYSKSLHHIQEHESYHEVWDLHPHHPPSQDWCCTSLDKKLTTSQLRPCTKLVEWLQESTSKSSSNRVGSTGNLGWRFTCEASVSLTQWTPRESTMAFT